MALPRVASDRRSGSHLTWSLKRWLIGLRWPGMLGLALLIFAGAFYVFAVQPARGRLQALAQERAQLATRLGSRGAEAARPTERSQLSNFYAFFPLTQAVPELLGEIARAAQRNGLSLDKGEYRLGIHPFIQIYSCNKPQNNGQHHGHTHCYKVSHLKNRFIFLWITH
jgi:hypothetical protein